MTKSISVVDDAADFPSRTSVTIVTANLLDARLLGMKMARRAASQLSAVKPPQADQLALSTGRAKIGGSMLKKLGCLWAQERVTIMLGIPVCALLGGSLFYVLTTPIPDRNLRDALFSILLWGLPMGFLLSFQLAWSRYQEKLSKLKPSTPPSPPRRGAPGANELTLPDEFLKLVNALLHQYEANYKSQEFFESIGCLFEFAHKKGFPSTRELLQFLQDNTADAVSRLGLRYQVSQHVPFFEQVIMERNPALRLHDDIRRSGGAVAFTDFSRDWLQDLVRTAEYHGLHWDPVSGRVS